MGRFDRLGRRRGSRSVRQLGAFVYQAAGWQLTAAIGLLALVSATEAGALVASIPVAKLLGIHLSGAALLKSGADLSFLKQPRYAIAFALVVAAMVTRSALVVAQRRMTVGLLYDVSNSLRGSLFAALANAKWAYLAQQRRSELEHAVTADVDRVQSAVLHMILCAQGVIMIAVYVAASLVLSPSLTLLLGISGAVSLLIFRHMRARAFAFGERLTALRQAQHSAVSDFLGGMKVIKSFSSEATFVGRLHDSLAETRRTALSFTDMQSVTGALQQVLTWCGVIVFAVFAIHLFGTPASVVALNFVLFMRLAPQISGLQSSVQEVLVNVSAFLALKELEKSTLAEQEGFEDHLRALPPVTDGVRFEEVTFSYPSRPQKPVIDRVSFTIPARKITALVGPSGAGKTTIADLLLGLLEPTAGRLRVDGGELDASLRRSWRRQVAYVPQDVFLLHDTIAANLLMGSPAATEDEIGAALVRANAAEIVRRLPEGLNTVVGDRGLQLSGGERQRIALARALLRNPQLLLLDEATSALDWESQALISASIAELRGKMTVVTIAHRLSMISFADWVLVVKDGRLVEQGDYRSLSTEQSSHLSELIAGEQRLSNSGPLD